jgi:hypothetical protein
MERTHLDLANTTRIASLPQPIRLLLICRAARLGLLRSMSLRMRARSMIAAQRMARMLRLLLQYIAQILNLGVNILLIKALRLRPAIE